MQYLLIGLIAIAGAGIPLQVAMNARLREGVQSAALSASLSFLIGAAALTLLTLSGVLGRGRFSGWHTIPWWAWLGGLFSAFAVTVSVIGLPKVGASVVIAATVFGQLLAAALIDHFGWMGAPRMPFSAWRIAGIALLFAGALLTQHK